MTTNGGVGIGRNLIVKEEVVANELITKGSGKIGKSLFVDEDITVGNMFCIDDKDKLTIVFKKNIIPQTRSKYDLGDKNRRWNNIFGTNIDTYKIKSNSIVALNLDIHQGVTIGNNSDCKPVIIIDPKKTDTVIFDGLVSIKPQKIHIDKNKTAKVTKSLILVYSDGHKHAELRLDATGIKKNTTVRVVLKKGAHLVLMISNDEFIELIKMDDYVELIWMDDKFTFIGGNV